MLGTFSEAPRDCYSLCKRRFVSHFVFARFSDCPCRNEIRFDKILDKNTYDRIVQSSSIRGTHYVPHLRQRFSGNIDVACTRKDRVSIGLNYDGLVELGRKGERKFQGVTLTYS